MFDLDGTLVDTSRDLVSSTNRVLGRLGLPVLPAAQLISFVGDGASALIKRSLDAASGQQVSPDQVGLALDLFLADYAGHLVDESLPFPRIVPALEQLARASVQLSVLTNKPEGLARELLRRLLLEKWFFAIQGGDGSLPRKPAPDGVLSLVAISGCSLAETVVVGDSTIDVQAARAAGVRSCAVSWGFFDRHRLAAATPDYLIDDPAELLNL